MRKIDFLRGKGLCVFAFILSITILAPVPILGQEKPGVRLRDSGLIIPKEDYNKIFIKDNKISGVFLGAELSGVLKEIEEKTGVKITLAMELGGIKIDPILDNLDVDEALKMILENASIDRANHCFYILNYSRGPGGKQKHDLKEVKIESAAVGSKQVKPRINSIEIPYGSGEGEIGVSSGGEGAIIGPRAFALDDKDIIYIFDTFNNRIQIYSPKGEYQSTVPLKKESIGMFRDMVVDNPGFIYLFDGMRLYQYDPKGNVLAEISVDKGGRGIGAGGMHIYGDGIFIYSCDRRTCGDQIIARISADNLLVEPSEAELKKDKERGKQVWSSKRYLTSLSKMTFRRGGVEVIDKDGSLTHFFSFTMDNIGSIDMLGEDERGNLYIKIERGGGDEGVIVEVHKFDATCEYISTITTPILDLWFGHDTYFANKSGDIYIFMPGKDKLRVNIFEWK